MLLVKSGASDFAFWEIGISKLAGDILADDTMPQRCTRCRPML